MSVRKRDNREIFEEGHGVPYVFNKLGLSILKNGKVVQEDEGDAGDEDFSEERMSRLWSTITTSMSDRTHRTSP